MKKGQIKFGESIGIIIIVYLVVVMGFVWYNNINTQALSELREEDRRNQAFEKYYFIVNLDLLHVSQRGFVDEEFDLNALRLLESYSLTDEGEAYLSSRLSNANITVTLFDSFDYEEPLEMITLYEQTPEREIIAQETFRTLIPVVDSTDKKTYLGVLEVRVPIVV